MMTIAELIEHLEHFDENHTLLHKHIGEIS